MKPTLKHYLKGFTNLRLLFAAVPFALPLIHACVPDSSMIAEYFYPPLGDIQSLATVVTFVFLFLSVFIVFLWCHSAQKIRLALVIPLLTGAATCAFFALIALYVSCVRRIDVPSVGAAVPVSVGYQRTDFALKTYPQWSDWAMLHDRGPKEEQVHQLWTQQSIIIVRMLLWLAYTSILVCSLSIVNVGVYQQSIEEVRHKSN